MRLIGKRALVTGGSSGIGRAIAIRFASEGARVVVTGRRVDRLAATVTDIHRLKGEAYAIQADHCIQADNDRAVAEALETLGGIDVLVNAAGVIGNDSIIDAAPDTWRRVIDTNLHALYEVTRRVAPEIPRGGSILSISSIAGLRAFAPILSYCVSKAAVDMLTRCLALELAPRGVRVNALNPGVVETELHTVSGSVADYPGFLARAADTHPLGRHGHPQEIAAFATFLVSDEASWITGGLHTIDGGRTLATPR